MVFPVVIYGCESWTIKKAEHQRIDAFELWCWGKTLESPLDCKEIQPVHPKGNQSWIFIGRIDAEAETPILWPPDAKYWLIGKDPDAGKDWSWEGKGMTEDEIVGCHHRLLEFTLTHVHEGGDAIQPSHPLSSPFSPAFNLSQLQGLFQLVSVHIRWPKYWSFSFMHRVVC